MIKDLLLFPLYLQEYYAEEYFPIYAIFSPDFLMLLYHYNFVIF